MDEQVKVLRSYTLLPQPGEPETSRLGEFLSMDKGQFQTL